MLLTIGELGVGLPGATAVDLGPDHPTRVGLVLIDVELDGDVVTSARLQPGFSHRGAEKLFEVRDYRQVLMLADRHDWQSPMHGELGTALVSEQLLGLQAPPRARWVRTLLAELSTCASLLAHTSWLGVRATDEGAQASTRALREAGRELVLGYSGNRVHPMATRLGGVAVDPTEGWLDRVADWAHSVHGHARDVLTPLLEMLPAAALGVLGADAVDAFGLSGPAARAAGVQMDLRPTTEQLVHAELDWPERTPRQEGSAQARLAQQVDDLALSASLLVQCCQRIRSVAGPVDTPLSKIIKLPDAEAYLALETPLGQAGFHLVSRGERTPWRLRLRTPSLANAQALQAALVGCPLDEVAMVVASLSWTIGDLDK